MHVYVNEDNEQKVECRDDKERAVGRVQVTPEVWQHLMGKEINWPQMPKENSIDDLIPGNVVGVRLPEAKGPQPIPYVVSQVDEDPDIDDIYHILTLNNEKAESIDTIAVYRRSNMGLAADYTDEETSRYVSGDNITLALVPDLVLADILDISELRSELVANKL